MGQLGVGARRQLNIAAFADPDRVFPWNNEKLSRVEKILTFLEFLTVPKGTLTGKKLELLPDQRAFIKAVYGPKSQAKIAIFSQPRGNGKTGLTAGLALCHLIGPECEFRGEIYCAAINSRQAAILCDEVEAMILSVPEF